MRLCEHDGRAARKDPVMRPAEHLVIYLISEFETRHRRVLARLGRHKAGKGCLYVKHLDDVDQEALRELIDRSVRVRKGIDRAAS